MKVSLSFDLSGVIKYDYSDNFSVIRLVQPSGLEIDLISRFKEIRDSFPKEATQLNYWICDTPTTKEQLIENHILSISGAIKAEFEKEDYRYSSWTSGTDYNSYLEIGGHDLKQELSEKDGKYAHLEINLK